MTRVANSLHAMAGIEVLGRQPTVDLDGLPLRQYTLRAHEPIAAENWSDFQEALLSLFPSATIEQFGPYIEIASFQVNQTELDASKDAIRDLLPPMPEGLPPAPAFPVAEHEPIPAAHDVRPRRKWRRAEPTDSYRSASNTSLNAL